ncbi:MAG: Swt1 family HEPN domain-containing protein [Peptococcaceae bacterium]|nr:Swt1 family HEPN domain-containing protein [Peptococcaceae bacterium]
MTEVKVTSSNLVGQGFDLMREYLTVFVGQEMSRRWGDKWWSEHAYPHLPPVFQSNLPKFGDWGTIVDKMDVAACFHIINSNWTDVFKYKMTPQQRNWSKELQTTRNNWAHATGKGLTEDEAARALDTMARFIEPVDMETAEEIRKLYRLVMYKNDEPAGLVSAPLQEAASTPASEITWARPWRQIAEPHPDVAQGRYRQAEFAADLSQVLRGTAVPEYQDPVEFFSRTFITDGMSGMLIKAAQRVAGKGGEPVIQLKTAFGGGKTHSMLALYHMMRAASPEALNGVPAVLRQAGIDSMPKVNVAVLACQAINPMKWRRPNNFPGITVNTLWGEMVAQLAEQSGDSRLYDLVKENDAKGVSPGSDTLRQVFDRCAPCVILIDELVAYARKLFGYKAGEIPAGTFDNVLSFVQELTEAARAGRNSIVVASIPESETETGGEAGNIALERIEHTFGRMEAVWKPVVAEEGFEIVRRRLFRKIADQAAVDQTCNAFSQMYRDNADLFPVGCREVGYLEKMKKCYPIHPEVFDRLYDDWATLDGFQRTRGVLRFMAALIHDLYITNDGGAMIMPGSIAFGKAQIREELIRYLNQGWDTIIENEVDGRLSTPIIQDGKGGYFGKYFAHSRIARTVLLGSAPDTGQQRTRGLHADNIRLGVVQPEEHISTYNDALTKLATELTYLYGSADQRYWFDTRPTLKKTATERARLQNADDVLYEIEKFLKSSCKKKEPFDSVHIAPSDSTDVPDQPSIRLVLLSPSLTHKRDKEKTPALDAAREYLEYRGSTPRMYRNMILFLATDEGTLSQLKQDMRALMAWCSIDRDADFLNLDNGQKKETKEAIRQLETIVTDRVQETWQHLLVPIQHGTQPVVWDTYIVQGANPIAKAAQKLRADDLLTDVFSPKILAQEMSLNNLWKDAESLSIRELWEDYTRYLYLYRLTGYSVLTEALEAGVRSGDYFAYADGQGEDGRYLGLCFGDTGYPHITLDGCLVKSEAARHQLERDKALQMVKKPFPPDRDDTLTVVKEDDSSDNEGGSSYISVQPDIPPAGKNTHFYGSVRIDASKLGSTAGTINTEVLQHLNRLTGARTRITLDIQVSVPDGVPDHVAHTIRENCKFLKFDNAEFGND